MDTILELHTFLAMLDYQDFVYLCSVDTRYKSMQPRIEEIYCASRCLRFIPCMLKGTWIETWKVIKYIKNRPHSRFIFDLALRGYTETVKLMLTPETKASAILGDFLGKGSLVYNHEGLTEAFINILNDETALQANINGLNEHEFFALVHYFNETDRTGEFIQDLDDAERYERMLLEGATNFRQLGIVEHMLCVRGDVSKERRESLMERGTPDVLARGYFFEKYYDGPIRRDIFVYTTEHKPSVLSEVSPEHLEVLIEREDPSLGKAYKHLSNKTKEVVRTRYIHFLTPSQLAKGSHEPLTSVLKDAHKLVEKFLLGKPIRCLVDIIRRLFIDSEFEVAQNIVSLTGWEPRRFPCERIDLYREGAIKLKWGHLLDEEDTVETLRDDKAEENIYAFVNCNVEQAKKLIDTILKKGLLFKRRTILPRVWIDKPLEFKYAIVEYTSTFWGDLTSFFKSIWKI